MDWMSINWVMIGVAFLVIINVIDGYKRGFVKELIHCISLIVLSFLTVLLSSVLQNYSEKRFVQMLTAMILIVVLIIGYKLIKMALGGVKILASLPVISIVNKLAGALFGVVEALVGVWVVFSLIGMFDFGALGEYVHTYINNNELLTYLYEHNLLISGGEKILGSEVQMKATDIILNQTPDVMDTLLK